MYVCIYIWCSRTALVLLVASHHMDDDRWIINHLQHSLRTSSFGAISLMDYWVFYLDNFSDLPHGL